MIFCKLSLESPKNLLNDGAKFYRKYKLCLHISTIERNANKTVKIRFYKLQLLKRFSKKYMDIKKKTKRWDFIIFLLFLNHYMKCSLKLLIERK